MPIGIPHRTRGIEPASARRGTWRRALESRENPSGEGGSYAGNPDGCFEAKPGSNRAQRLLRRTPAE